MASYSPLYENHIHRRRNGSLLQEMEETFFICSICEDQFKEPKLLPCLHRYCRDCLETITDTSRARTAQCPVCEKDYVIPNEGVDRLKTDFHLKIVIELKHLRELLDNEEVKKCTSCSQEKSVGAYCFKCKQFLCERCFESHVSNSTFTDHQPHLLCLQNIEAEKITLGKLAELTENPRCGNHEAQVAQLFCKTCGNLPVCMTCIFGEHQGHDLNDVSTTAKSERELLDVKLEELDKYSGKPYYLSAEIKTIRNMLENNLEGTEMLRIQCENRVAIIREQIEKNTTEQVRYESDRDNRRRHDENEIIMEREKEINLVRKKYKAIIQTMKQKYREESEEMKKRQASANEKLKVELCTLENKLKSLTESQERLAKQSENELKKLFDHCEQIMARYENLSATASSIIGFDYKWADALCIPDIRAASDALAKEMEKLPGSVSRLLVKLRVDDVTISDREENAIDIKGMKEKGWLINGMTSSSSENNGGTIVVTGVVSQDYSHITVIDRDGEVSRQDELKRGPIRFPYRYCCFLTEAKTATVCLPDEIGIYDVRDGSYDKLYMSDIMSTWPVRRWVWCVATDPVNNHIVVGTNSRFVYVFDDRLNYDHKIILPREIVHAYDIIVHGGRLLVCDTNHRKAYSVTMETSESKLVHEFSQPDLDGGDWSPISVCTDKRGFIYILWQTHISNQDRRAVVQYSKDGRLVLAIRCVDKNSRCVTALQTNLSDALLVSTLGSGKMYTYGLSNYKVG